MISKKKISEALEKHWQREPSPFAVVENGMLLDEILSIVNAIDVPKILSKEVLENVAKIASQKSRGNKSFLKMDDAIMKMFLYRYFSGIMDIGTEARRISKFLENKQRFLMTGNDRVHQIDIVFLSELDLLSRKQKNRFNEELRKHTKFARGLINLPSSLELFDLGINSLLSFEIKISNSEKQSF